MTWRNARFTKQIPTTAEDELRWIAGFSSSASNLATFLHSQAKDLYGDHFSCASPPFHADFGELAGYFALVNDSIPLTVIEGAGLPGMPNITIEERRSRIK